MYEKTIFILLRNVFARNESGATREAVIRTIANEAACTLDMDVTILKEKYRQYVKEQKATAAAKTTS